MTQPPNKVNRHVILVMSCSLATMACAWIYVPYYKLICKKIGLSVAEAANVIPNPAAAPVKVAVVPRLVQLNLMGVVNEGTPVDFYPLQHSLQVQPGKSTKALWRFTNLTDKPLEIQAVHNVVPAAAEPMLHKTVCFCFTKQTLQPRESKIMPVVFSLDPKLDKDTRLVTLGYTLFNLHPENPELLPSQQQHHQHKA